MQNKGFVKLIAVLLTLICIFYMSFSVVTNHYETKAEEIAAAQGQEAGDRYLDSVLNAKVYVGNTLKECREMGIGLGLDLKGGMNVILEVSVPDVVKALSDHKENTNENFRKACDIAEKESAGSQSDFITVFINEYKKLAGNDARLAEIFATQQLRDRVNASTSNKDIENVLREEVDAAIENSHNVLRSRIDQFGVAQPNIQALEGQQGRIMIEMPGIKEPERVRKLLQGSANLEFWETYEGSQVANYLQTLDERLAAKLNGTADETKEDTAAVVAEAEAADTTHVAETKADTTKSDLAAAVKSGNDEPKAGAGMSAADIEKAHKEHPLLSRLMVYPNGCTVGVANKLDIDTISALLASPEAKQILPGDLSLKWAVKGRGEGEQSSIYELYAIKVPHDGHAPLEGDVISTASDEFDQNGHPCVSMTMNADGARRWAALTKANIKRSVAIVLDDRVYSAPVVQNEITGGNSQITGNFTVQDTKDLSNVLRSGKMPAPAKIVSEEIVGPSLGAESIQQGIWSCVIAFVILMLYMIMMYGFTPGMVANCALIVNLFFTVGILTSFQAALTMSGIAGMVLSLGMAVDANVLIYERTKEEMKAGKKVREALAAGYNNAFSAIFDSNLTSIITGIILYVFGAGPIRGFALTLIIGIIVSFFTAVFLTRIVYEGRMAKDKWLNLTFTTSIGSKFFQNPNYKFMSVYKRSFAIFGVLAVASIAVMSTRGFSKSIDFTGGRNFVVVFDENVSPETVRPVLEKAFPESNTSAIALGTEGKTIRISTNYRIEENGVEVDSEIEAKLHGALKEAGLVSCDAATFINRDVREGGSIISSQKVGPSVAKSITRGAFISVCLAFVAIFVYILARFRNWAFSVGAITALIIDIILILGMYSICWGWMPFSLEIDQTFIGAVLTAIGYSINDKVVVFDRIREFITLHPKRDRQQLFNTSLNTTLTRTINTSVSTFIVLAVIFCLGGASIRSFAFAMILGVIFGTLSSIFVAAPTAYLTMGKTIKENEE